MTFFSLDRMDHPMPIAGEESVASPPILHSISGSESSGGVQIALQPEDETARHYLDQLSREGGASGYRFLNPVKGGYLEMHLSLPQEDDTTTTTTTAVILYGQLVEVPQDERIQLLHTSEDGCRRVHQWGRPVESEATVTSATFGATVQYRLHLSSRPLVNQDGLPLPSSSVHEEEVEEKNSTNLFVKNCFDTVIKLGEKIEGYQKQYTLPPEAEVPCEVWVEEGVEDKEYIVLPPPPSKR